MINKFINGQYWHWKLNSSESECDNVNEGQFEIAAVSVDTNTQLFSSIDDPTTLDQNGSDQTKPQEIYDLCNNQVIIPGLCDAHIHISLLGESQYFVDLSNCYSIDELKNILKAHIDLHPDLEWIQGVNWDQTKLGDLSVTNIDTSHFSTS